MFMSPELVMPRKKQPARGRPADIWASGVTLYNLLTQDYPFQGKSIVDLQHNLINEQPNLSKI
jgi:serine/threonine protein kinase